MASVGGVGAAMPGGVAASTLPEDGAGAVSRGQAGPE